MFNGLRKNPKQTEADGQPPRVMRIPRMEWTIHDMEATAFFFKSPVFEKLKAVCDGYLLQRILNGASDEYRKGWMDHQAQLDKFKDCAAKQEDSSATINMQFEDE